MSLISYINIILAIIPYGLGAKSQILSSDAPHRKTTLVTIFQSGLYLGVLEIYVLQVFCGQFLVNDLQSMLSF